MHPMITIALRAARDAAEVIALSSDRLDRVQILDDSPTGYLTSMDETSNKSLLYHLQKAYPKHSFHSRVTGFVQGDDTDHVWLLDPLVGNRNFAAGYTQFAVSVACQIKGIVTHAVIICPLSNEEFTATRGDGASLNSRRIRVSSKVDFEKSLISINPENLPPKVVSGFQAMLNEKQAHPRMTGCTPIDMLNTACNRVQGGWSAVEDITALAAAYLILQEAGGLLASENGNPEYLTGKEIMFSNPRFFKQMLLARRGIEG